MSDNKADTIENYILDRLSEHGDGKEVELKRTELATIISCAPSQITYVLSTRFTNARGFQVESRRGLGGYIKITVINEEEARKQLMYREMMESIGTATEFEEVKEMIDYLFEHKFIRRREAEIIVRTVSNYYESESYGNMSSAERARLTRSILHTLSEIT